MNRRELRAKAAGVVAGLLREKGYVAFVDLFMRLGYLSPEDHERWRRRRVPCLERVIHVNLAKVNFIMKSVRAQCTQGKLRPSWTAYRSWGKGKKTSLRFSKSGEDNVERAYATHFVAKRLRAEGVRAGGVGNRACR